jgi:hypothetical protein
VRTKALVQSQSRRHHLEFFQMMKTNHLKACHHLQCFHPTRLHHLKCFQTIHLGCRGPMCPSSTVDAYMRGSQEASRSSNSTTGDGLLHLLQFPPRSYSQNYNGGDGWNNDFCSQTDCRQSTKIGYSDRRHAQIFAKFLILYTTTHTLFQFCKISARNLRG